MIVNLSKLFITNLSVLEPGTAKVTPEHSSQPAPAAPPPPGHRHHHHHDSHPDSNFRPNSNNIITTNNHNIITNNHPNIDNHNFDANHNQPFSSGDSSHELTLQYPTNHSNRDTSNSSTTSLPLSLSPPPSFSLFATSLPSQAPSTNTINGRRGKRKTNSCSLSRNHSVSQVSSNLSDSRMSAQLIQGDVPTINFTIDIDNLKDGALTIVHKIRPEWPQDELHCKLFTDGITNRLVGVYHGSDKNDMILIRVYGENTDLFIDRAMELRNMRIMHKAGLSAPVYCAFNNGISYGYSPGIVADGKAVRDPQISGLIAETMARMHTLSPGRLPVKGDYHCAEGEDCLFPGINKFLVLISSAFPVANGCKKLKSICNIDKLDLEVFFLERELKRVSSPIVFCHNDLLLKNIVYSEDHKQVSFIDFEYSDYNYQAFDIANHFIEFCGVDEYDYTLYPSKEFQLIWIEKYLRKWHSLTGKTVTDSQMVDDVEELYDIVSKFTLGSLLYWGLWALVQATNSSIDFDYLHFAQMRIDDYFRRKELLFKDECTCRLSAHNGDGSF